MMSEHWPRGTLVTRLYERDSLALSLIRSSGETRAHRSPSARPAFLTVRRLLYSNDSFHSFSSTEFCSAYLTPLKETVDNYLFRGLDGDSLLAADCVRRMLRSRSGQSDRLEDDDAGAGNPLPLSRGEGASYHGQTVKSRQAADFSRKRSANLNARNRAAAPRT